ncbi:glutamine amidotransferase [Corynebacterium poyangense]|uniref:Lipid II isoglutaminyl synthase (glutamine-hydrolyzing) subunit GatD n=1 Tax=Corynebacterium poyangense TaxID=2684405 RepID=A0A7H0SLJ2_9CORY|nr:glutamine amidotransferase [Corynebacterium poyangense]MBZ8177514.1 glutamine amidotransferase [Corynebacterium poyangense]QNQ89417.1 glutamine amidotransferase [Corynebacterium poyangense]
MPKLSIGLILPDVLGTYGDDGNALVLRQRAQMRGIQAHIHPIHLGEPIPDDLDLYTLGGGEDTAQILAAKHLLSDGGLTRAASAGRPIFAICAGFQVLGQSFRAGGRIVDGVGLIDATTVTLDKRAIGEVASRPTGVGLTEELTDTLTGFENHMGATLLSGEARPLGTLIRGVGNTDEHGASEIAGDTQQRYAEGVVQGSVIATYMHGPALARNPQLADLLLAKALGMKLAELEPLEIPAIEQLRKERLG